MNLNSDYCMKFKFSKHRKAQNVTLLFVSNLLESLDTIWHPRWLPKKKDFNGGGGVSCKMYIFEIFMSEICLMQ